MMKRFLFELLLLLFLFPASKAQDFNTFFENRTLRVDYFRQGSSAGDTLIFSRFVRKSGGWAGPVTELLDPFDNGPYRVLLADSVSGRELYSRCYGSLFDEYCATPQNGSARFQEVVLLPWPRKTALIRFQKRDAQGQFYTQAQFTFNPDRSGCAVIRSQKTDYVLLENGDAHHKMDIVIVAQGYGPRQKKLMRSDMKRFADNLLRQEPFRSHCQDFNIYAVSGDAGAHFNTLGSDRYLMTEQLFQLHDLLDGIDYDHIIIMVNSPVYGGGAIYNFYACSSTHPMSDKILPHELGHSIGGLADEYVDPELSYEGIHALDREPTEPNITTLVDFSSKWADLLPPGTPIPTAPVQGLKPEECGPVGVYEGAGYQSKGIYRPVTNCMMNYYADFCPVCTRRLEAVFSHFCR